MYSPRKTFILFIALTSSFTHTTMYAFTKKDLAQEALNNLAINTALGSVLLTAAYCVAEHPVIKQSIREIFDPKKFPKNVAKTTANRLFWLLTHEGSHCLAGKFALDTTAHIYIGSPATGQIRMKAVCGNKGQHVIYHDDGSIEASGKDTNPSLISIGNIHVDGFDTRMGYNLFTKLKPESHEHAFLAAAGPLGGILSNALLKTALQDNVLELDENYLGNIIQLIPWSIPGMIQSDGYHVLQTYAPNVTEQIPTGFFTALGILAQLAIPAFDIYQQSKALCGINLSKKDYMALTFIALANDSFKYFKVSMDPDIVVAAKEGTLIVRTEVQPETIDQKAALLADREFWLAQS